ncbi:ABC transporter substrate-binding protein [Acetobacter pasteurianus]
MKEIFVKLTYSLPLAAFAGLMALSKPASAQNMISSGTSQFAPKTTPHAVPTLFAEHPASLEQLLNSGYEIRSSASSETGSSMILFRPAQPGQKASWVRCELIGDRNGNVVLRSSHNVTSDCRDLN